MKLLAALLFLILVGCASNLTEEEIEQRKYERQDRYNIKLEQYFILEKTCPTQIWVRNPSRQYQQTGVPTWEDLVTITCGQPAWMY